MELYQVSIEESVLDTTSKAFREKRTITPLEDQRQNHHISEFSTLQSKSSQKRRKKFKCSMCNRKFKNKHGLKQHFHDIHLNDSIKRSESITISLQHTDNPIIFIDENLNNHENILNKLQLKCKVEMKTFPPKMRGYCDELILNFLIQNNLGLVTQDKQFAIRASKKISPVFLISQNAILKLEKI